MTTKHRATIDDLYPLPENGKAELVKGELLLIPPPGPLQSPPPGRTSHPSTAGETPPDPGPPSPTERCPPTASSSTTPRAARQTKKSQMTTRHRATIEDLYRVPDNTKAELVNGELALMSPTG